MLLSLCVLISAENPQLPWHYRSLTWMFFTHLLSFTRLFPPPSLGGWSCHFCVYSPLTTGLEHKSQGQPLEQGPLNMSNRIKALSGPQIKPRDLQEADPNTDQFFLKIQKDSAYLSQSNKEVPALILTKQKLMLTVSYSPIVLFPWPHLRKPTARPCSVGTPFYCV